MWRFRASWCSVDRYCQIGRFLTLCRGKRVRESRSPECEHGFFESIDSSRELLCRLFARHPRSGDRNSMCSTLEE